MTNERGKSGEGHLHFLIGKNGLQNISDKKLSLTLNLIWADNLPQSNNTLDLATNIIDIQPRRGIAWIEPFDKKRKVAGVLYVCKREFDFLTGKEYTAVYKLSRSVVKHISEIRDGKQTKGKPEPAPLIIEQLPLVVGCFPLGIPLEVVSTILEPEEQNTFRNKDPPRNFIGEKGVCGILKTVRLPHSYC